MRVSIAGYLSYVQMDNKQPVVCAFDQTVQYSIGQCIKPTVPQAQFEEHVRVAGVAFSTRRAPRAGSVVSHSRANSITCCIS